MEIIDAHAHIYPEKIAEKATKAIGDFYGIEMEMPKGIPSRLLETGKKAGVSRFVVHSCATKASQVRSINEFIKSEHLLHPEFIPFMTLHQDLTEEEVFNEVDWAVKNGFKGIKMHPDFQKFNIDDDNALKFYEIVGDKLPFLFHTGDDRFEYSKPYRMVKIAKKYKKCTFIGAHFGGYRCWNDAPLYKGLDNMFFDTSSSIPFIGKEKAKELINMLGSERFFFGTDFPMWDATEELQRFMSISLSDNERESILSLNIKRLLNI